MARESNEQIAAEIKKISESELNDLEDYLEVLEEKREIIGKIRELFYKLANGHDIGDQAAQLANALSEEAKFDYHILEEDEKLVEKLEKLHQQESSLLEDMESIEGALENVIREEVN